MKFHGSMMIMVGGLVLFATGCASNNAWIGLVGILIALGSVKLLVDAS